MFRCTFYVNYVVAEGRGRTLRLSGSVPKAEGEVTAKGDLSLHVTDRETFAAIDALKPGDLFDVELTPPAAKPPQPDAGSESQGESADSLDA